MKDIFNENLGMLESVNQFTLEAILSGIHYFRSHDYLELVALVNLLSEFVSTHPKVAAATTLSLHCHHRLEYNTILITGDVMGNQYLIEGTNGFLGEHSVDFQTSVRGGYAKCLTVQDIYEWDRPPKFK